MDISENLGIVIDNAGKRFNGKTVFHNLSAVVHPSEFVGVIGPSGCGKSTLLKCINGLLQLDEGTVQVGEYILKAGERIQNGAGVGIRQKVGMVFQHLNLWSYKTALENIIEGPIYVKRMSKEEAIERAFVWAKQLGIEDHIQKYPSMLSGGQRQRVAIARAAIMEPEFLLLDEITSALDPVLAGEVTDILIQLKDKEHIGIVVVSHQIDFIRRYADRVCFLYEGGFKEEGDPQKILTEPQTPELRTFIESVRHGW